MSDVAGGCCSTTPAVVEAVAMQDCNLNPSSCGVLAWLHLWSCGALEDTGLTTAVTYWFCEDFVHICQELSIVHDIHAGCFGCCVVLADDLNLCWCKPLVNSCDGHAAPACAEVCQHKDVEVNTCCGMVPCCCCNKQSRLAAPCSCSMCATPLPLYCCCFCPQPSAGQAPAQHAPVLSSKIPVEVCWTSRCKRCRLLT